MKITCEYDTVTKKLVVSKDGKACANIEHISFSKNYRPREVSSVANDMNEEEYTHCMALSESKENKDHCMTEMNHTYASLKFAIIKGAKEARE